MMAGKEVRKVLKRLNDWFEGMMKNLPKPVLVLLCILGAPLLGLIALWVVLMMLAGIVLLPIVLLSFQDEVRIGPEYYQYTYEVVHEWRKELTMDAQDRELLDYGSYAYNSYLLLFPRETPSTLEEYYFEWNPGGFDVDSFAVYFTCKLTEENYEGFAQGIADFAITTEKGTTKLLYDDEHFAYPAYIAQWMDVGDKWEVMEYIMLDEENHTAVFVFNTLGMTEEIEENSIYTITPSIMDILSEEEKQPNPDMPFVYGTSEGFSIYANFETATYDLSFLDYLK